MMSHPPLRVLCVLRASMVVSFVLLLVSHTAQAEPNRQKLIYEGRGTGVSPRVIELFTPNVGDEIVPEDGWPVLLHIRATGGKDDAELTDVARAALDVGYAYADVRPDNIKANASLKAAGRYLIDHAQKLRLNPKHMVALGIDDGAGPAARLVFVAPQDLDAKYGKQQTEPYTFAGLIVVNGIFDYILAEQHGAEYLTNDPEYGAKRIIGGNPKAGEQYLQKQRERGALHALDETAPPTLIIRDRFHPLTDQSAVLAQALHGINTPVFILETSGNDTLSAFLKNPATPEALQLYEPEEAPAAPDAAVGPDASSEHDIQAAYLAAVRDANVLFLDGKYKEAAKAVQDAARAGRLVNDAYATRLRVLGLDRKRREKLPKDMIVPTWAKRVANDAYGTFAELPIGNGVLRLRWCEPGDLIIAKETHDGWDRPTPEAWHAGMHEIADGFWMLEHEVTQELYDFVRRSRPSAFIGEGMPLERITKEEAEAFCAAINRIAPGINARLPTAYEWQYAATAGTPPVTNSKHKTVPVAFAGTGRLDDMGWHWDNSGQRPHPVMSKLPNAWGLFDMHGNVSEWTATPLAPDTEPKDAKHFIVKGGSWTSWRGACRAGAIDANPPDRRTYYIGFRFVADAEKEPE